MEPQSEKASFLIQAARNRLLNFCQLINPKYESVFFHEIIAQKLEETLEKLQKKEKVRLILTIPPRHGKSQLASIYFPAWALGKEQQYKIILSTYGAELAEKMGLSTRDVIASDGYQAIFPNVQLRADVKAKAKWMTNKQGSYTGVGVGTAVTGIGADILIIDDLHKNREEAESQTVRETAWEYYRSTLYSRLEGYGAVIVIMQRWHQDDLVGKLLEEQEKHKGTDKAHDKWEVINFPAIAEEDEYYNDQLIRKRGESLWPSKFPLEVLENIRQTAGVYNWISQYQQDPILAEFQEFKQNAFKYFNEEDLQGKFLKYSTIIDPAISQKRDADNTVVLTIAKEVNGPNWYRIREDAGKFTPQQTIDLIFVHQNEYHSEVYLETVAYQMALKYSIIEEQKRRQRYFVVHEIKSSGNKELRIRGLLPLYSSGVVYHRQSDTEYERELLSFPRGKHDDRIDTMAMGLQAIENTRGEYARQYNRKVRLPYGARQ